MCVFLLLLRLLLLIFLRLIGGDGNDESAAVSPASLRARLEFLAAELAAQGMLSENSSGSGGSGGGRGGGEESPNSGTKLDIRRSDALKLADRVEALKRVERSLLNCKRLGDAELLQACDKQAAESFPAVLSLVR